MVACPYIVEMYAAMNRKEHRHVQILSSENWLQSVDVEMGVESVSGNSDVQANDVH